MKIKASVQSDKLLDASPSSFSVSLKPGDVKKESICFRPDASLPSPTLPKVSVDWEVSCKFPLGMPLEAAGTRPIFLKRDWTCPRRQEPVKVDGLLDDWDTLPLICSYKPRAWDSPSAWESPEDSSFSFAVEHDDEALYIAVRVTDDSVRRRVKYPEHKPWYQDGIEIRLDARTDPERSLNRGDSAVDDFAQVCLSPKTKDHEFLLYPSNSHPEGLECASIENDGGFTAELIIPASYLDEKQGRPWTEFRLNVAVDDFDLGSESISQLWWRPDWRKLLNFDGSGTFSRE